MGPNVRTAASVIHQDNVVVPFPDHSMVLFTEEMAPETAR